MSKKLVIVVSVDWFFLSHRLPLAEEALKKGYEVVVVAVEEGRKGDYIRSLGMEFYPLPTTRSGMNPFRELRVLLYLIWVYLRERPDIVHHVAVKPVTYGSIAAKLTGVKRVVNALSGMGFLFINANRNRLVHHFLLACFKFGFSNPNIHFILQNEDDFQMVKELGILSPSQLYMIKGSGVNLAKFPFSKEPETEKVRVLLPARMLWDKGVGEFVRAAEQLYPKYKNQVEFVLCGGFDEGYKLRIEEEELQMWHDQGKVNWIGYQDNMPEVLAQAHIVVLPSYREGLPKSLIEACSVGRPIITTDVPGCRAVVDEGGNGYLVPCRNRQLLAEAIEKLIVDKALRLKMGKASRTKAEHLFSLEQVVDQTFTIYEDDNPQLKFVLQ
jgi:glycosyltransferase involved in cell wall biosynthesis